MIGFLDLPGEIRNLIYKHLLVFKTPIVPWAKLESLPTNLLYANKTIHHEFGSLFYSRITFDFSKNGPDCGKPYRGSCSARRITSFLDEVGQNAKYIQTIVITFPLIIGEREWYWEECWRFLDNARVVRKIAANCPGLKNLILASNAMLTIVLHVAVEHPDATFDLLHMIDKHLRIIPSLRSLSVMLPDSGDYFKLADEMESEFGWVVDMVDPSEFDWMGDDDDDDEDEDEDGDSYDSWDDEDSDDDDDEEDAANDE